MIYDLLESGPSSCEKHLDKFFKICHTGFWQLHSATCSRLIPVMKNACFALWGLFLGQFSKKNSFFPRLLWLFIVLYVPLPSKLTVFPKKILHFLHHLFTNLQEKVWILTFPQSISCFLPLNFWILYFFWIWKYDVEYGLWIFCWVWCLGFIGFW